MNQFLVVAAIVFIGLGLASLWAARVEGQRHAASVAQPTMSVLEIGARFHANPDAVDGGNWQPMSTAPRDGTVVELRNTYGVAPSYSLSRWTDEMTLRGEIVRLGEHHWAHVNNDTTSVEEGSHLSWRPYIGDPATYIDPTGGLQRDSAYWRGASAQASGLPLDAFEAIVERNLKAQEQFGDGTNAPTYGPKKWNGAYTLRRGVWVEDGLSVSDREIDRFREEHRKTQK